MRPGKMARMVTLILLTPNFWVFKYSRHSQLKLLGPVLLTVYASANCLLMLKLYCQVFIKDTQWRISAEKVWTELFLHLTLLNKHFRRFPFRRKSYGRRGFKWITQRVLLTFALVKLLAFAPLFNAPKKFNILCLKWQQLLLLGGVTAENRERVVEGRGFFPRVLIYFEFQKNTLSKHIVCQAMLFLICFRK